MVPLMSYVSYLLDLPAELQRPLLQAFETLEQNLRAELVVRRQDILDMRASLLEMQQRADERFAQTQEALSALAEAQRRTEQRVEELAEAQRRTEQRVEELAEAQRRSEERIGRLEVAMAELAEAQRRSEERIGRLEVAMAELAEAQRRSEERIARLEVVVTELAEAQRRTEQALIALSEDVRILTQRVDRIETTLGRVVGEGVERRYRERAGTYLAKVLQKIRVVPLDTIMDDLEKALDAEEIDDLLSLDLLINGKVRQRAERPEVWIACEASSTIERGDVTRARRRADLLRKAGYPALAAVAGEQIDDRVLTLAQNENVLVLRDGKQLFWEEALRSALGA
jgi:chromosome segregation ATPase